jgi:tetratricopeptide (TPR) repeat protein
MGLALLRAGKTTEGMPSLSECRSRILHSATWFNLGIAYKKAASRRKQSSSSSAWVQLVPDDAISRYNLGAVYRLGGRNDDAIREFRTAAKLDSYPGCSHFQLFNLLRDYWARGRGQAELEIFQTLKKQQEGAAIPEDVEWNMYAEVYDIAADVPALEAVVPLRFEPRTAPHSWRGRRRCRQ